MIDVLLQCKFDDTDVGHHYKCKNADKVIIMDRIGIRARSLPLNPLGRHPFNIITEEIYKE